jgi:hypothetical protein
MQIEPKGTEETIDYNELILAGLMSPARLNELPRPKPLIEHFLNLDTIAAIYGRYGSLKTFLALAMACCVASGLPWFGHAVHQGPVLYVLAEGVAGMAVRQTAWLLSEGMTCGSITALRWYPSAVNLLDSGWAQGLATAAATLGVVLVVIDTLNRSMPGGRENDTDDMGRLVAAADCIRRASGATVLFVHHPPRGGTNLRGSTALEGAVDTALFTQVIAPGPVVRLSSGADGTTGKQKDMASFEDIYFELEPCHGSAVPRLTAAPATYAVERHAQVEDRHDAILVQLDESPKSATDLARVIPGVTRRTINRTLSHMQAEGTIYNCNTSSRPVYDRVRTPRHAVETCPANGDVDAGNEPGQSGQTQDNQGFVQVSRPG